jgi:hypothetical protein
MMGCQEHGSWNIRMGKTTQDELVFHHYALIYRPATLAENIYYT